MRRAVSGKTATVVNLAAALAGKGKSVLILDLDPQANATKGMGDIEGTALSTYDVIKDPDSVSMAEAIVQTQWKGLDLIPSCIICRELRLSWLIRWAGRTG